MVCIAVADYCFGDVKFGGNAQAITKQRFLHHTSMLWNYQKDRMQLLSHPAKIPDYRAVCAAPCHNPCLHIFLDRLGICHGIDVASTYL